MFHRSEAGLILAVAFLASSFAGASRAEERLGRGVVALRVPGAVYVSWRLLRGDPPGVAFDVYRASDGGDPVRANAEPIAETTDFLDALAPEGGRLVYTVRPREGSGPEGSAAAEPRREGTPYLSIPLEGRETRFQKVALGDLDGDGEVDFVLKTPDENIDPAANYWRRSSDTYKLEAYLRDGRLLWRKDLGWAIERGIWYSPYIAFDLDGDGKAEVAAKVGEGDPRDPDGRVTSGPEWLALWSGLEGREIARAAWPDRKDFPEYNRASRNQIAVAYLDGKSPALLALRGTYDRMRADAYRLRGGALERLWSYDNEKLGKAWWGQGAHFTLAGDLDGDGRDEVILGSAVLDGRGRPLWTTGKGHPDAAYLTDVDPRRPGLEIAYVMETAQKTGGLCAAEAATGKILWELGEATRHVHGKGLCADIDPTVPGMEVYGADSRDHRPTGARWLFSADGKLLARGEELAFGFDVRTAYWDADLEKEIVAGGIRDHRGLTDLGRVEGRVQLIADVLGDWREEIIASVPGELRIYSTAIPAADRRTTWLEDRIYRLATAMNAMGYTQDPTGSVCLEAVAPNLSLAHVPDPGGKPACRAVVSAPLAGGVKGRVELEARGPLAVSPASFEADVAPGGRAVFWVRIEGDPGAEGEIRAALAAEGRTLRARTPVRLEARN
ncbi:MAG: rhamnogalacturonan lyase family protein [Planctomycetota bacterium]